MTEEQKAKIEVFANELVASEFKVDDDGYLRHIRSGCFNGNGLLEPISIDCLEEKIKACAAYGIGLCEMEIKRLKDIIVVASEKGTNIDYCSRIVDLQAEIEKLKAENEELKDKTLKQIGETNGDAKREDSTKG